MSKDTMLSAVTFIQSLEVDEIEEVLDWLDQLTSAYRTVLVVKRLLDRKPESIELPECLLNQFPVGEEGNAEESKTRRTRKWTDRRSAEEIEEMRISLRETMKKFPQGARPNEIAEAAGLDNVWVSKELNNYAGTSYHRLERARWVFLDGKSVSDYLHGMSYVNGDEPVVEQTYSTNSNQFGGKDEECCKV